MAADGGEKLLPFIQGTRVRRQEIKKVNFVEGGSESVTLPSVGLLAKLWLEFNLVLNIPTTNNTIKDKGVWSLLKNVKVSTNLGSAELFRMSGFQAFIYSHLLGDGARASGMARPYIGDFPDLQMFNLGLNMANNNVVKFFLPIPINANMHRDFEIGLINLQADTMQAELTLEFGKAVDFLGAASTATITSGTVTVHYVYAELPPEGYAMPPAVAVRRLADKQTITSKGEQTYKIPRMGTLTNLIHHVELGDAVLQDLVRCTFKAVDSDTLFNQPFGLNRAEQFEQLGLHLPPGVALHNFWYADGFKSAGSLRDAYNSAKVALLESKVIVPDSATLDANKNDLHTIRTTIQSYTV